MLGIGVIGRSSQLLSVHSLPASIRRAKTARTYRDFNDVGADAVKNLLDDALGPFAPDVLDEVEEIGRRIYGSAGYGPSACSGCSQYGHVQEVSALLRTSGAS